MTASLRPLRDHDRGADLGSPPRVRKTLHLTNQRDIGGVHFVSEWLGIAKRKADRGWPPRQRDIK
jgi:hypothetical protein